jgi:hypothetical protein
MLQVAREKKNLAIANGDAEIVIREEQSPIVMGGLAAGIEEPG